MIEVVPIPLKVISPTSLTVATLVLLLVYVMAPVEGEEAGSENGGAPKTSDTLGAENDRFGVVGKVAINP